MRRLDRIDVLIPHFEDVAGLQLSLASIKAQTVGKFRVVIADDGSSKDIISHAQKIIEQSELDIELLQFKTNRGRPYVRNELLDAIESPYVTWLDAGDEWYPEKTATQLETLKKYSDKEGHFFVTCNYDWKWVSKPPFLCEQNTNQDQIRAILVGRTLRAYLWTLLATSSAMRSVGYFDTNLPRLQDVDFFLRFCIGGGKLVKSDTQEPLSLYHKDDQGRHPKIIHDCGLHIFNKHQMIYDQYGSEFINNCRFELEVLTARYASNNQMWGVALHHFAYAFLMQPKTFYFRLAPKVLKCLFKR